MTNGYHITVTISITSHIVPPRITDNGHDRQYWLKTTFVNICSLWYAVLKTFEFVDTGFNAKIRFSDSKNPDDLHKNFVAHLRREFGNVSMVAEKQLPDITFLRPPENNKESVFVHGFRCELTEMTGDWGSLFTEPLYWRDQVVIQCYASIKDVSIKNLAFDFQLLAPGTESQCPSLVKISANINQPNSGSFRQVLPDTHPVETKTIPNAEGPSIIIECKPRDTTSTKSGWEIAFGVLFQMNTLAKPGHTAFRVKIKRTYSAWLSRNANYETTEQLILPDINAKMDPRVNLLVCGLASGSGRKSVIKEITDILKPQQTFPSDQNGVGPILRKHIMTNIAYSKKEQLTFGILDTDGYHFDDVYDYRLIQALIRGLREGTELSNIEDKIVSQNDLENSVSHVLLVSHALHLIRWSEGTPMVNTSVIAPLYQKFLELLANIKHNGKQSAAQTRIYIVITHMEKSPLKKADFMDSLRTTGIPENMIFPVESNATDCDQPPVTLLKDDPVLQYLDQIRSQFPQLIISQIESCRKSSLLKEDNSVGYSADSRQHLEDMLRYML